MKIKPRKTALFIAILAAAFTTNAMYSVQAIAEEAILTATAWGAAPVVQSVSQSTIADVAITFDLAATDSDGDAVRFQLVDAPRMGTVKLEGSTLCYTPAAGKTGIEKFTYCAVDSMGNLSETAQIVIDVNKNKLDFTYADMTDDPNHLAALMLAQEGVLVGECMGDAYFLHPNDTVTRSEFIAMAASIADLEVIATTQTDFIDDQSLSPWAKAYVSAAAQNGLVSGYLTTAGTAEIRGEQQITLAEASVIVAEIIGESYDQPIAVMYTNAVETVPAWAADQASLLLQAGVLTADMGTVGQQTTVTRSQACAMLWRACEILEA